MERDVVAKDLSSVPGRKQKGKQFNAFVSDTRLVSLPVYSYRDYIDPARDAYLSDIEILDRLESKAHATPFDLASNRYRENVIRLQCRDLVRVGVVSRITHDTFTITDAGRDYLAGTKRYPTTDGLFDVAHLPGCTYPSQDWRLTDFSILDPDTIKQINYEEFKNASTDEHGWVDNSPDMTRRRIWNVKRCQLNRIIREFPTNEPLPQQCAHWMRAFAGLHFFPDGNHRTGMNTLQILVEECDFPGSLPIAGNVERFVLQSKLLRHLTADIRFNTLWKRDEHYRLWHQYFRSLLCDVDDRRLPDPSTDHLRQVLNYAREQLQL